MPPPAEPEPSPAQPDIQPDPAAFFPGLNELSETPPIPATETNPPAVALTPAQLEMIPDRHLIDVNESMMLALHVSVDAKVAAEQTINLSLSLPPAIKIVDAGIGKIDGDTVTWQVTEVKEGIGYVANLQIMLSEGQPGDVYKLSATLHSDGYQPNVANLLIGVNDPKSAVMVLLDPTLKASGVVVEVKPYTPAPDALPIAEMKVSEESVVEASSEQEPSTGNNTVFLPIIDGQEQSAEAASSAISSNTILTEFIQTTLSSEQSIQPEVSSKDPATPPQLAEPLGAPLPDLSAEQLEKALFREDGVTIYAGWQIDALQNSEKVEHLEQPATVVFSVKDLIEKGVDPATLELWTRASKEEAWQPVRSTYDAKRGEVTTQANHFSEWSLGNGLSSKGQMLPSMRGFSSDHQTGFANFSYPIDTPTGLGGMSPNLSLSYSSGTSEDIANDAGNAYNVQASWAGGFGWNLGGMSYIAKRHRGQAFTGLYSMVLNGTSLKIWHNGTKWVSDPYIFLNIEHEKNWYGGDASTHRYETQGWTVTTPDGTKYYFGSDQFGVHPNSDWGEPLTAHTAMLFDHGNGTSARAGSKWYLRLVQDPSGNRMEYDYSRAIDYVGDCLYYAFSLDWRWYTRATYLTEVRWSGNYVASPNVSPKMRVRLINETGDRPDWQIDGWDTGNPLYKCAQPQFGKGRLSEVITEVLLSDGVTWWQINKTKIDYPANNAKIGHHSVAMQLRRYGDLNSSAVQTYTFTYVNDVGNGNSVRMSSADNGWGGKVNYEYSPYGISCQPNCTRAANNHYAVTKMILFDGIDRYYRTDISHDDSSRMWKECPYSNDYEACSYIFLGHESAEVKTMAPSTSSAGSTTLEKRERFIYHQHNGAFADTPKRGKLKEYYVYMPVDTNNNNYLYYKYTSWSEITIDGAPWVRPDFENDLTYGVYGNGARNIYAAGKTNRFTYDAYGNMTVLEEFNDFYTFTPAALMRKTVTTFFPNTSAWILNKPARVQIKDANDNCYSEVRTLYDANTSYLTPPTKGLPTYRKQPLLQCFADTAGPASDQDEAWDIDATVYDGYGNITRTVAYGKTTAQDDDTRTEYDTFYRLFPLKQYKQSWLLMNATGRYWGVPDSAGTLSHNSDRSYWGAMAEYCEPNQVCTRQGYDDYGRPTNRWERVLKGATWDSTWSTNASGVNMPGYYLYANTQWFYDAPGKHGSNHKTFIVTEYRAPRCEGNFVRKHYDGLGQLLQEQRPQQNWKVTRDGCTYSAVGDEIDVDYGYDGQGQQIRVSIPHAGVRANWLNRRVSDWNTLPNNYTYFDVAGRPNQITSPIGEQQKVDRAGRNWHIYTLDRTKNSTQEDYAKTNYWQILDGLGNVIDIRTWNYAAGGTWVQQNQITMSYDKLGNLVTVNNAGSGASTTIGYDKAGRKTSMNDSDLGNWTYAYDRQGHLIRQTDAKNQSTCLYYETILWRLQGKKFVSGSSCPATDPGVGNYNSTYVYDSGDFSAIGQLIQVVRQNDSGSPYYEKRLLYQANGMLSSEKVTINGAPQQYTTGYSYDSYLRHWYTIYPDNELVSVRYNSMGLTDQMWSSTQGPLIDGDNNGGAEYDVEGRLRVLRYPSGGNLWLEHAYFPWTGGFGSRSGKLYAIVLGTTKYGEDRLSHYYENYDSFGNILYTRERQTSHYHFNYDAQNRLTCAYASSSGVNSTCVSRTGSAYAYDLAGRLTTFEGATLLPDSTHRHAVDKRDGLDVYDYDANGNMISRKFTTNGFPQTLSWDPENHLVSLTTSLSANSESYAYDADGQRVKKVRGTVSTYYPNSIFESTRDQVWIDEGLPPAPTVVVGAEDGWNWVSSPTPYSGSTAHASVINSGLHQHYFYNAPANNRVTPGTGEGLYAYVYLDPANPPQQVMLQWHDVNGWEHRAYWGQNIILGLGDANYNRYMGPLPATGTWVRLEVPASLVGLENVAVDGMAFTLYGGRAWWDKAGVSNNTKYYIFNNLRFAMRKNGVTTYLHADHLGSTIGVTDRAGILQAREYYQAYGAYRTGPGVPTDRKFTGQIQDGSGLQYFNARYYDPQLGTFISPDTIVPDPGNVFDFNRYMYVRGNPMKFNDPSGHCGSEGFGGPAFASQSCGGGGGAANTAAALAVTAAKLACQDGDCTDEVRDATNVVNVLSADGDPTNEVATTSQAIQRGMDTLRMQADNVRNWYQFRLGAEAHLARAHYYNAQGTLQSVHATGKGTIDLVLNNNTGVEVKYQSATRVMNNVGQLASQIQGFSNLKLKQITIEFVQTLNNPVTQTTINELKGQLFTQYKVNLSNIVFTIVSNPGVTQLAD